MNLKKTGIVGLLLILFAGSARADSLPTHQIAQEIRKSSPLSLRENVAGFWAKNLFAAQDPSMCSYCASEPDSLQLSINAVLKAISLEQTIAGFTFCNLSNCIIPNDQSTVAIDNRVNVVITRSAINFENVPVATPEPSVLWFLALGTVALFVLAHSGASQLLRLHVNRFDGRV